MTPPVDRLIARYREIHRYIGIQRIIERDMDRCIVRDIEQYIDKVRYLTSKIQKTLWLDIWMGKRWIERCDR